MTTIIGSAAAREWFADFPRLPKDVDAFTPYDNITWRGQQVETFWHSLLEDSFPAHEYPAYQYASPDQLYTIKASHTPWDLDNNSWSKHVHDLIWLKNKGAVLDVSLYNLLYKVWQEVHGQKKVKLAMSAGQFFADAVPRIYDHDSIHSSVAYGDHALYEDFLKPGEEIDIDMPAVKAAPHDIRVKLYREEVAATALERIIIPSNYTESPGRAWNWALKRTVTSLVRGWSARFMIDNIAEFVKPDDYVRRHQRNADRLVRLEEAK